ncbi:iron-sulfur cluster repair di-iron protein [bacterium]|jgi:regulator of cell morphogenesis and NO signaling|nr:iron-sulfur cluster repair di-iron protein [bacterium]
MDWNKTVGQVVTEDYRTALAFKKLGVDFCCRGNITLSDACDTHNIPQSALEAALAEATSYATEVSEDFANWELDRLAVHIVQTHHTYVKRRLPEIEAQIEKVVGKHGATHPELFGIAKHFAAVAAELRMHMMKEEQILFPVIREMAIATRHGGASRPAPFGSIRGPISVMEAEHTSAGGGMAATRQLSSNFTPPEDACNGFRLLYNLLEEFETDLHQHIHLENNILFPRAITMEEQMHG